jgi:hypothetical protein
VGVAVTDLLRERRLGFMPVTIHGGHNTTRDGGAYNVPKTDLVAAIEVPFHKDVLQVASGLKLWAYTQARALDLQAQAEYPDCPHLL